MNPNNLKHTVYNFNYSSNIFCNKTFLNTILMNGYKKIDFKSLTFQSENTKN